MKKLTIKFTIIFVSIYGLLLGFDCLLNQSTTVKNAFTLLILAASTTGLYGTLYIRETNHRKTNRRPPPASIIFLQHIKGAVVIYTLAALWFWNINPYIWVDVYIWQSFLKAIVILAIVTGSCRYIVKWELNNQKHINENKQSRKMLVLRVGHTARLFLLTLEQQNPPPHLYNLEKGQILSAFSKLYYQNPETVYKSPGLEDENNNQDIRRNSIGNVYIIPFSNVSNLILYAQLAPGCGNDRSSNQPHLYRLEKGQILHTFSKLFFLNPPFAQIYRPELSKKTEKRITIKL